MRPKRPKQKSDFSNTDYMQTMLSGIRRIHQQAITQQPPTQQEK